MSQHIDDLPLSERASLIQLRDATVQSEAQLHRDGWLESLTADRRGSLDLHPDLLFPAEITPPPGLIVIARWRSSAEGAAGRDALAVLRPRKLRIHLLPGPSLPVMVSGHRLVGDQIIGCGSPQEIVPFVKEMSALLASGQTEAVILEDVEMGGSLHQAAMNCVASDGHIALHPIAQPQPHWWIDFPESPADYWKKFSGKTRHYFRSTAKKLEHSLVRFTTGDDVARFLQQAEQVSQRSWQAKRLGPRVIDGPEARRSLERLSRLGAFRSYILEQRGRPIAFALCRQWNGKFDYQEIGYDVDFGEFSPGTVLLYRLLEDLIAHDSPRLFDFDSGEAEYKRMFGNRQTQSGPIILTRRAWRYSLIFGLHRSSSKTASRLRSWVGTSKSYKLLRRLYRR
jgi:CelD/BcsL family acetyltransferase involved in cellulose biosynthesis